MRFATVRGVWLLLAALVLVPSCRTGQPSYPHRAGPSTAPIPSRSSDILNSLEIRSAGVTNAHEAIVRLRPEFLRRHGVPGASDPTGGLPRVYVDGVRQAGPDMLLTIPAGAIVEIRYLNSIAAGDAFGFYNPTGVIAVRTQR